MQTREPDVIPPGPEERPTIENAVLRLLLDASSDAAWIARMDDLQPLYVNAAVETIYGRPAAAFIDDPNLWREVIHPRDRERVERAGTNVGSAGSLTQDYRILRPDGAVRWLHTRTHVMRGEDGSAQYVGGLATDITERRKEREMLREREATLRSFYDGSHVMMGVVEVLDDDIVHRSDNSTAARFFGTTPAAMKDRKATELGVPSRTIDRWLEAYRRCAETGMPVRFEYDHDGERQRRLLVTVSHIGETSRGTHYCSYIVQDVTEVRRSEHEARKTAGRLASLIQNLHAGILFEDETGTIVHANDFFCQLFGIPLPSEALVGKACIDMVAAAREAFADADDFLARTLSILSERSKVLSEEIDLADGRTFERDAIPLVVDGVYRGHLWHYRDVTERKRHDYELRLRSDLVRVLADINHMLISRNFGAAAESVLGMLGETLAADRVYLFAIDGGSPCSASQRFEWCGNGVTPQIANPLLQNYPFETAYPRWHRILGEGRPVNSIVADLPEDERSALEAQGIRSIIVVPVHDGERLTGFIGIDDCSSERRFPDVVVDTLSAAAGAVGKAWRLDRERESVRRSEERYRSLVGNIPGIVYRSTPENEWQTLYVSEGVEEFTGYAPVGADERPVSLREFIHAEDLDVLRRHARSAMITGESFEAEVRVRHADGRIRWMHSINRPCFRDGRPVWIDGVAIDITERRRAEDRLRILETALDNARETVIITDAQLELPGPQIIYVNRGFEQMTGYPAEEALGKTPRMLQGPTTDRALMETLKEKLRAGDSFFGETTNYRRDGQPFRIEWSINPVRDERGRTTHYVSVQRDITDRHATEAALAAERAFTESAINTLTDLFFVLDPEGRIIRWNRQLGAVTGLADESLMRRNAVDIIRPDDRTAVALAIGRILREGVATVEAHLKLAGGRYAPYEFYGSRLLASDGTVEGIVGIGRDLTQRHQAEAALFESESKYRSVVENVKDVVFQADAEGRLVLVNPAWTATTGIPERETHLRSLRDFVHDDDRPALERAFHGLLCGEIRDCRLEIRVCTRGLAWKWMELFAATRMGEDGPAISGMLHDVSRRREAMGALEAALARERELGTLKSRFVSMASHELRTPLTAIQSSAELLEQFGERWSSDRRQALFERILNNVRLMNSLIEDVLTLGRADSGRLAFEPELIDLGQFCAGVAAEIRQGVGVEHEIRVLAPGNSLTAEVDPKLLRHVLANLIANAVKYSPALSLVTVELARERDDLVFRVSDRGIGIPEEDLERLFEPFHRASNADHHSGTGLGLTIVKRAVDLHGGTVEVKSTEGEGSIFTVRIPVQNGA